MHPNRRELVISAVLSSLAVTGGRLFAESAPAGLYRVDDPRVILAAARALITEDTIGTLITVDPAGQPRARSILVSKPDDDLTLWMGTRAGSRKLEQIAANPTATLHFSVDTKSSYASLMGEARVVSDPVVIQAKNPYQGEQLKAYFPHFPVDFALLSFKPHWLEVMAEKVPGRKDTWQPQGVSLG